MMHARTDYDPIQDPRPDGIPDDEPVFLLRAQDVLAPYLVLEWAFRYESKGGNPDVVERVRTHARRMMAWQEEYGSKVPDVPDGAMR